MKLAVFDWQGGCHVGRVKEAEGVVERLDVAAETVEATGIGCVFSGAKLPVTDTVPLSLVTLRAPIPRPARNVFCIGKNYREHVAEMANQGFRSAPVGADGPKAPIVFSKVPETVIAPGAAIEIDAAVSTAIDYEAELAVIIGKEGRCIAPENAMDHVWGFTIINDVSARDLQLQHTQWLIGKSQDTFCPMGPWAVTADEVDLADTSVKCWVNDELRQDSNTALMIFDVPTLIAVLSNGITLKPGDVIATGTPAGVGMGFDPPKYLKDGDRVKIEIAGIGTLENPVKAL
ncbi:fumarylacetoacetate hydrolase family protein [Rhodobium gokarnense]|uniref:2-keto-4-pentenoate hydratase/2-oxohepta-3-ene-1,7-dioic acid hydratase in catechol pathway n=1 Tax=Rhodobium gokarnense TaxID=364296 RepID=A0ABT3HH84_9HYPH|nr:fumarylacetoacetate hydrolase family protein [Rhodobium gokarnense]MCW2309768.1 2-keto-4-pentenoate hydratase/2-oxohepta-3-ene-1,7-dioic acid hydratase in catechol pathway [Rhodobium gokarnense]